MIVAVDFDGTLHLGQYPGIGDPAPYAAEMMRKLANARQKWSIGCWKRIFRLTG